MLCTVLRQHLLLFSILIQVSQSSVILFGEWRRSALSGHTQRWTKTVLIQFPQGINNENHRKYFQHEIFGTFSKLFHKYRSHITARWQWTECNSSLSIQCGRVDFKTTIDNEKSERWIDQHMTRAGWKKNLSPRQESNPSPPEHREGEGGGHSIHWVTRTHEEQGYSMKREHRVCRAQIKFFWAPKV